MDNRRWVPLRWVEWLKVLVIAVLTLDIVSCARVNGSDVPKRGIGKSSRAPRRQQRDEEEKWSVRDALSDVLTSDAAKVVGGGTVIVAGTYGVRRLRRWLRYRAMKQFERPATPVTDLLGHVLYKNDKGGEGRAEGGRMPRIKKVAAGDVLSNKVVALYFDGKGLEDLLASGNYAVFRPRLQRIYRQCQEQGREFEVVYVPMDSDRTARREHFASMPWYALPFDDRVTPKKLMQKFRLRQMPSVVLIDEAGQVINKRGYNAMLMDPEGFPWEPKPLSQLVGTDFIDPSNRTVSANQLSGKVVGLYFSANWCPPCKQFTPVLAEAYKRFKEEGKDFEVIFVSNDEDASKFYEYFGSSMPWLAIPYGDSKRRSLLQSELEVASLPTLVLLDENRQIITKQGRALLASDPQGKKFPWRPKPVTDLAENTEKMTDYPSLVVFMEASEPKKQRELESSLEALAKEQEALPKEQQVAIFTATNVSPRSVALRNLCKLEVVLDRAGKASAADAAASKEAPNMIILDIPDEAYYVATQPVDASSVRQFVRDFQDKKLKRIPMQTGKS
ncbi:unnamed protein product [Vitrella brassicaformis CCMP3155]|uniref:Thioredoxin domain-containing protein n=2 Tax=Vitrella brassicaformis TaxID=1169539 RepID=A0A0G4FAM2_VITBC|nr:unnamed protein product [Vitrella brassicaformis CCMP3155]|eukprot:CEM09946.1 unnamed protein product [Vitrella brassicaformis CCMP3155]